MNNLKTLRKALKKLFQTIFGAPNSILDIYKSDYYSENYYNNFYQRKLLKTLEEFKIDSTNAFFEEKAAKTQLIEAEYLNNQFNLKPGDALYHYYKSELNIAKSKLAKIYLFHNPPIIPN